MTLVRKLTVMPNLFQSLSLRSVLCAGVVAVGLTASPVSAGYQSGGQPSYGIGYSPDQYRPEAYQPDQNQPAPYSQKPASHYKYKEITVYELREVPEAHWITKYDHCGKAYQVKVVSYHSIKVPVTKRIKVPC